MTFKDVVTLYDDVAYLKWEPISTENSTPIRKFTALITLPDGVDTQHTDTREWMHFKGDGSIRPKGRNALYAQAPTVGPENYVDVVSIFKASAMEQVRHRSNGEYKELAIQDERKEQVDAQGVARGEVVGRVVLYLLFLIPELVAVVVGAVLVVKSHRQASPRDSGEYYRDIPDISPTVAAQLLCDLENPSGDSQIESKQLAATMLSLVEKKAIAIYPGQSQWYAGIDWAHVTDEQIGERMRRGAAGEFDHSTVVIDKKEASEPFILRLHDEKGGLADTIKKKTGLGKRKKTSTIVLLPGMPGQKGSSLTEIETSLLALLQGMGKEFDSDVFDFQDIHDGLSGWLDGPSLELDFHKKVHAEYDDMDLTHDSRAFGFAKVLLFLVGAAGYWYLYKLFISDPFKVSEFSGRQVFAFHGHIGIMLLMAMPVTFLLILEIFLIQTTVLTDSGRRLTGQVMGLRNYLRDFGDFEESEPEDLALWDQYLIYATAFGISGKLARGMVKVWPQIADGDWLDSNGSGSLLYWSFYPSSHDIQGYSASDMNFGDIDGFGDIGDLGSQLSSGFSSAGGSFGGGDFGGGGSFGGSDGGSGGGSFGAM
nr:DUF2207 domain-containing protein [Bifidobacterium sp. ESL0784]